MANERKLIPFFGAQLERIVNGLLLRLLILVYYGSLIGFLIQTVILYQDETRAGAILESAPHYNNTIVSAGIFITLLFGYWIVVYLLSNVFIWLLTGKAPKK